MQFAENLTDRQAADAVRDCIAWKYALSLSLTDAGLDYSVLCEFRHFRTLRTRFCEHAGWALTPSQLPIAQSGGAPYEPSHYRPGNQTAISDS